MKALPVPRVFVLYSLTEVVVELDHSFYESRRNSHECQLRYHLTAKICINTQQVYYVYLDSVVGSPAAPVLGFAAVVMTLSKVGPSIRTEMCR